MSLAIGLLLAAAAELAPICTDRPGKASATCTVPAGGWQIESSVADWSRLDRDESDVETLLIATTVVKLGLTGSSDLQVGITPFVGLTTGGERASGFGDTVVRYKRRMTADDSNVQVAAIPFVKLPTADKHIGNGKVEGGLAAAIAFPLGRSLSLTLGPEIDWLADGDGRGRHPQVVQLVALSSPLAARLTVIGDLWASWNFEPEGTVRQASADVAFAYLVRPDFQVDAGANLGLTRDTPGMQLYGGFSVRF